MATAARKNPRAKAPKRSKEPVMPKKRGLYANIQAKRKRIAAGSGEKMRKKSASPIKKVKRATLRR
jgi:hypothetical protein